MDDDISYILANFDFNTSEVVKLHFSSRYVGDVSPVIAIASGENQACPLSSLRLSEGIFVQDVDALRQAEETAYTVQNNMFVFRVEADSARENITAESPQGMNLLEMVCQD